MPEAAIPRGAATTPTAASPTTYQREIALAWSDTAVTPASRRLLAFVRDRF